MVLVFVVLAFVFEVFQGSHTSGWSLFAETVRWVSPSVAVTITILAFVRWGEMFKQRDERLRREGRQEGRQEERQEWADWLQRMREAQQADRPFDEPAPSEKSAEQAEKVA
jgi:hypothetical protein